MPLTKGFILGLHNVETYSKKFECSNLYRNLTITPEFLEELIISLKEKQYNFVSMEQFLKNKENNNLDKNIVITIDDGWKGIYIHAYQIFKKYKVPFVFYVATDIINNGFKNCKLPEIDGMNILCDNIINIENNKEKQEILFKKLWNDFKHKRRFLFWRDNYQIMQSLFDKKINIDFDNYKLNSLCSIPELKEMVESGLCELGSHSDNHIHIDRINKNKIIKQILSSNKKIENFVQKKCLHFSYPYGHFNNKTTEIINKYYDSAVIVNPKFENVNKGYFITKENNNYEMPRIFIDMGTNIENFLPI